jgi:tRNA A37 threonylcarbamoyladenosine synthetase subunit TsaC/SUA5/YrdC
VLSADLDDDLALGVAFLDRHKSRRRVVEAESIFDGRIQLLVSHHRCDEVEDTAGPVTLDGVTAQLLRRGGITRADEFAPVT